MMTAQKSILLFVQVIFIAAASPLVSGFIRKVKNNLRMRTGPSIFQPYYNFLKLLSKDEVVSKNTSWIFAITPAVMLASSLCACFLIPLSGQGFFLNSMGDLLAIFFILAIGRFFLALAALDSAGAFGGMGSSREMFISGLAEPAAFTALFTLGMNNGSTSAFALTSAGAPLCASVLLAGISFFMVMLAETSRIPVDNRETHLELTMIHEAMVLEYSGKSLAVIELAGHIRQMVFFTLLCGFFFPAFSGAPWQVLFPVKICVIAVTVAAIEVSLAKMRLFRAVDYLGFAFFIALLAAVAASMGA